MESNNTKRFAPVYLKNFKCIASNCEETCCKGWVINVDSKTFKMYRKVDDPELKALVKQYTEKNKFLQTSTDTFGKINLHENMYCPFFHNDKLCKFQKKYGENYLSSTCYTYPKVLNLTDNNYEICLDVSCPEAARTVLLNKEPIKLIETTESIKEKYYIRTKFKTDKGLFLRPHKKYFYELRELTINILQKRELKLYQRLLLLGAFCKMAHDSIIQRRSSEIPLLIKSFPELIYQNNFMNDLFNIDTVYVIQLEILKKLSESVSTRKSFKNYSDCFEQFLSGIGYNESNTSDEIIQSYKNAYTKYYEPFMEENEHILENYLVNYIYKSLFPFAGLYSLFDSYIILAIHYSIIKLHLIGMASFHKGLTEDLCVKLIYLYSRTFEHNQKYFADVLLLLRKNNFCNLASISVLIKN